PSAYYRRFVHAPARHLDSGILGRTLHQFLRQRLPDHLVPSAVMVLDSWPLTFSGKLDRKALPAPDYSGAEHHQAPGTQSEEILCALFEEMLGTERVGTKANFFEMGGHSLMVMRVIARIQQTFGVAIQVR